MNAWRNLFILCLSSILAFSTFACSDDSSSSGSQEEEDVAPDDGNKDVPDPGKDEPDPGKDGNTKPDEVVPDNPGFNTDELQDKEEPKEGWKAILLPNMVTDVDVAYEGNSRLSVMLVSIDGELAGDGLVGEKIKWGIESGNTSLSLGASVSTTKDGGVANVTISSRKVAGDAVVIAASDIAPKNVSFNVRVLAMPIGNLRIHTSYNGNAPVKNYSIRLYDGKDVECAGFDPMAGIAADPLFDPVDNKSADFLGLQIDQKFTAVAYGYSEGGAMVAAGCLDSGLSIYENQTTEGTVYLDTINLDISHTYHARSYFDLGDVVGALGTVGTAITTFTKFVDNPGNFAYDLAIEGLKTVIPGWIIGGVDKVVEVVGLKQKLIEWMNGNLIKNASVCKVGLFACQFRNIVRLMEFTGNFDVVKMGSIELKGSNQYNGLAVYWYDDRLSFSTEQIKLEKGINFLEGSWNGSLANGYDKLAVESHVLQMYYGEIVMTLINHVLLPRVADGATSFDEALAKWINVDGLSDWLQNTIKITLFGKSWQISKSDADKVAKFVFNGVKGILNFGEAILKLQKAGSDIEISGTAKFADTNYDNVVDIIDGGQWSGSMTVKSENEVKSTSVRGIWSAYNKENVETGTGMYCTHPKTTDADARSCDFPPIDRSKLNTSDMCEKYKACAGN